MSFERVRPGIRLVAQVALVLPSARVELGVRLEVAGGGEAQRALGARVRFVARVRPAVDHELAPAGEPLVAVLARVPVNERTESIDQPNSLLQSTYGLSPVCVLAWSLSLSFTAKPLSQMLHLYGISPVWARMWTARLRVENGATIAHEKEKER